MRRVVPLAVTLLLVVASTMGAVGMATAASDASRSATGDGVTLAATNTTTTNETANESNGTDDGVPPGARLAGVIGAQQTEYEAEVATRSLGVALGVADSNSSKAAVLANYTERIRARIAELQNRTQELERAYENGTISRGVYVGRSTALTARIRSLERLANRTSERASELPEQALRAAGVNVSEIRELENVSRRLGNSPVTEVAERVAGPNVGVPVGPPSDLPAHAVGPGNASDRGERPENGADGDREQPAKKDPRIEEDGNESDSNRNESAETDAMAWVDPGERPTNPSDRAGPANRSDRPDGEGDDGAGTEDVVLLTPFDAIPDIVNDVAPF
ncbi:MAG: hypothetical protein ABEJ76_04755 [Halanaeroarchaeum sp.]